MPATPDEVYLAALKEWLRKERYPGDRDRLFKTVRLLKKLDVRVDEVQREELRRLISICFAIHPDEIAAYVPLDDETEPIRPQDTRGVFPVPPGMLRHYMEATAHQESPQSFHAFALLTILGAALGRRVWLDMVFFKVWPNLSVVLTGPAGGPRKNTAWDMALDAMTGLFDNWGAHQIADASPAALVEELAAHGGRGFVYAPEFRHFFPSQQYMEGAVPLITRLLDNPDWFPVSRITRKASSLRNVTLTLAGGSTLDWLAKLPQDAQGGGFFTRVMLIHEENPKPPNALPKRERELAAAKVQKALSDIDQFAKGEVRLTQEGRAWYKEWYEGMRKTKGIPPRLLLYYNRKQTHLLRIALMISLPGRTVRPGALEWSRRLLEYIEGPLPDVYRLIGMSKSGEMTRAVLDTIRAIGGRLPYARLVREMKGLMNERDLKQAVGTLKEAGQIQEIDTLPEHVIVLKELNLVE